MQRPTLIAILALSASAQAPETRPTVQPEAAGGLQTVTFNTTAGAVHVRMPDDAGPGDTISGVVIAEPSGDTPEQKQQNLGVLTGAVVEFNKDQRQTVEKEGVSRWVIPAALAGGVATLILRTRDGRAIGESQIAIPARAGESQSGFELPSTCQVGRTATVRGPFNGDSRTSSVRIGGAEARVLAESPRKIVIACPRESIGPNQIEVRKGSLRATGQIRNVGIRLEATKLSLLKGERATLTVTVLGLAGIRQPAEVTLRNDSPTVIQVGGGVLQKLIVPPSKVRDDGTYSETRPLTGIRAGGFNVTALLQRPIAESVDLNREIERTLDSWQRANNITMPRETRQVIRTGVAESRATLDRLVSAQASYEPSATSLLIQLLRHYCFDLRDAAIRTQRSIALIPFALAFQTPQPRAPASLEPADVQQYPFAQFAGQFDAGSPKSYLDLTSLPTFADIAIDNRRLGFTNRSAVVTSGEHSIRISSRLARLNCKKDIRLEPGQTERVSCAK